VCAGVGLAAGLGFFVAAIAGTVLALFMLFLDRPVSFLRLHARKGILHVTLRDENGLGELMAALLLDDDDPRTSSDVSVQRESDGRVEVEVLKLSKPVGARLLARTSSLPSVVEATFSSG